MKTRTAKSTLAISAALKCNSVYLMWQTGRGHISPIAEGKLWITKGNIGIEANRFGLSEIHEATFDGETLCIVTKDFVEQVGASAVCI